MAIIEQPVNTPEGWGVRAELFPEPWLACGWSRESQQERFRILVDALNPKPGERLLDYGCGTGHLTDHLPADVEYVGFDWAPGMVSRAGRDHPGRIFTTHEPTGGFDLVAVAGTFNLPFRWSKQRSFHTIRHLWDTHRPRALAASFYAGTDANCLIYTQAELETLGAMLTWDARAVRWRTNDLLLSARR